MENFHTPVLLGEATDYLKVCPGGKYIDATIGGGGHTAEILKRGGTVLGIDWDPEAINYVGSRVKGLGFRKNLILVRGNFKDLEVIARSNDFNEVGGIIFDLGVSSHQLLTPERGFSFATDAPLDMRMDPQLAVGAADLVNGLDRGELYELFSKLGEEYDTRIVRAIVRARAIESIKTCRQLADLVVGVKGGKQGAKIHPATRVFQALRIAVNGELENLRLVLPQAVELLKIGGRLVVISFHSLEDRIVKEFFKNESKLKILTKHPIRPSEAEIGANPRSKSAKMRVAERI